MVIEIMGVKIIDLFGTKWRVKFVDHIIKDDNGDTFWGRTNHSKGLIEVGTVDSDGRKLSNEELRLTLLHEIMHAVFGTGQYWSMNDDEPLVEWCARCLNSIYKSKILEL